MGFFEAVKTCFARYFDFRGRARRSEYWWFVLFTFLGGFVFGFADAIIFGIPEAGFGENSLLSNPLANIFSLLVLIPSFSACVRRLHDINKTGWYILMPYLPIVLMVVYSAVPGQFGPSGLIIATLGLVAFLLFVVLIIMLVHDEGPGDNKYGESPKYGGDAALA